MQNMLDVFTDYCKQWKLYVNIDKTKVVVFSKRRYEANHKFKVIGEEIQFSDNYCYLGVLFNYNGNITNAKKRLIVQSQKALYSVYYKIRNITIPIDLQLKIFDALVAPILLYGSEVLGFEKNDNIEKVHLQFLKKNLGVRITTPNFLVYGELGRYPLIVNIKCRMLCFWGKLVSSEKLSSKIYNLTYNLYKNGTNGLKWIDFIKKTFDEIGLSFIFTNQLEINPNWIKVHAKQILCDQFVQRWRGDIANSSRSHFYSIFKQEFCMEPYLTRLTEVHRKFITKLRVNNIKFPIETGRWRNINREDRICQKCSLS